jgi:hypothetical protein
MVEMNLPRELVAGRRQSLNGITIDLTYFRDLEPGEFTLSNK